MEQLPKALAALAEYPQFILWTTREQNGKLIKLPINYKTAGVTDAHNPDAWTDAQTAITTAKLYGDDYGVGFVFTAQDPFFFVDIDHCLEDNGEWSKTANTILSYFPGAAVEVSQSGTGLHIFGKYTTVPEHAKKNIQYGLELYTERRFVALTGNTNDGDSGTDHTGLLAELITNLFTATATANPETWTNGPVPEWNGTTDDNELIDKALATKSGASVFGSRASFADLWTRNEAVLSDVYSPDANDTGEYDESSADAALAQHLAFWTGNNCDRIFILMYRSALVRDKWKSNKNYLTRTILKAVSQQATVYTGGAQNVDNSIAEEHDAPTLKGSVKQKDYAGNIRAQKLIDCQGNEEFITKLCARRGAVVECDFWIDNAHKTPAELVETITPVQASIDPLTYQLTPLTGLQLLGYDQQVEHFKGCVYVQDLHKIFTPSGSFLKSEQFNATYGGYTFVMDDGTGKKETRKAWEAFTESQLIRFPKAETTCFRPDLEPGAFVTIDNKTAINTYVPVETKQLVGDATRFLDHLAKLLPDEHDRAIVLAYMAAIVQYKGVKFQWAPLLQGLEGNGKSLLTHCVMFAISEKFTHMPRADEMTEKYNEWLFGTLFIGIEDIYIPEHKLNFIEILKPMITNRRQSIRQMGVAQVMKTVCCNFIFNSNHKDAIRKTRRDRRFSVFYTAQQDDGDLERDGMGGDYFVDLYNWLEGVNKYESLGENYGYAVINNFLSTYAIPDQLNPATNCRRAPHTSSTDEAVDASLGGIEQEILEAIEEGRPGFAGGWISSTALAYLLDKMRKSTQMPQNKRRNLLNDLGYDYHPALAHGRVNNPIAIDNGAKPRLYIKRGHIHANLQSAAEVAKAYQDAQNNQNVVDNRGAQVFGNN